MFRGSCLKKRVRPPLICFSTQYAATNENRKTMEEKLNALCVRVVDYKDNDRLITLCTAEKGKILVKATGVKNPKAKLKFAASPLCTIIDSSYYFYRELRLGATASTPISTKQVFLMKSALEASDFYKQLSLIERFAADIVVCRSCLYRFQILSEQQRRTEISYLSQLWSDMKNRYPADMLNKNKSLIQLSDLIRHKGKEMSMLPFRQKIFSIKNSRDKRHKIVRVLGLELKFERKKCRTEADACQA